MEWILESPDLSPNSYSNGGARLIEQVEDRARIPSSTHNEYRGPLCALWFAGGA